MGRYPCQSNGIKAAGGKKMYIILSFLIGSAISSASLCFLERKEKKSWFIGRSECPKCHHQLEWFELIPVFSYLIQQGQCRNCKCEIPQYTLIMEIYGGVVGVLFWMMPTHSIIFNTLFLVGAVLLYRMMAKYMVKGNGKE